MSASIIDGREIAQQLRADIAAVVRTLAPRGIIPGLAVVLVGDNPASQVYVRNKARQTVDTGMRSFEHRLPVETSQDALLEQVQALNANEAVDGILVQLPLPPHIDPRAIIEAINPGKDVDGFHPINAGRVAAGAGGFVPCTPLGALMLIRSVQSNIAGLEAVVVGRSNIVGKPMAHLLLAQSCTVTVAHSRTRDLNAVCARADILVAAVGKPEMIEGAAIKPGAIVIDVGINRVAIPGADDGKTRLVGDVAYAQACERAGAITPVPGGVGPMTIACLLRNTLEATHHRRGLSLPGLFIAS